MTNEEKRNAQADTLRVLDGFQLVRIRNEAAFAAGGAVTIQYDSIPTDTSPEEGENE